MAQIMDAKSAFERYAPVSSKADVPIQDYSKEVAERYRQFTMPEIRQHTENIKTQQSLSKEISNLQRYSNDLQSVFSGVSDYSKAFESNQMSAKDYRQQIENAQIRLSEILSGMSGSQNALRGRISEDVTRDLSAIKSMADSLYSALEETSKQIQNEVDFENKSWIGKRLANLGASALSAVSNFSQWIWDAADALVTAGESAVNAVDSIDNYLASKLRGEDTDFKFEQNFQLTPWDKFMEQNRSQNKLINENLARVQEYTDSNVQNVVNQLTSALVGMVPMAATAGMAGTASLPNALGGAAGIAVPATQASTLPQIAKNFIQASIRNPVFVSSALPIYGRTYSEAKAEGANELEATAAAVLNGFLGGVVETSGGIGKLPENTSSLLGVIRSAVEEGGEEVLQGIIENAVSKGVYDETRPLLSISDENAVINPVRALQEFALGAAAGGIMSGAMAGARAVANIPQHTDTSALQTDTQVPVLPDTNTQSVVEGTTGIATSPNVPTLQDTQVDFTQADTVTAPVTLNAEQTAVKQAADRIGVNIVFDHSGVGDARIENGVIHINPQAANVNTLFTHELTHHIEQSGMYNDFMNFVMDSEVFNSWLGEGVTQAQYRNAVIQQYAEQGVQLDEMGANKEMLARFVSENLFQNQNAIEQLAVKNRGLFDKIREWIKRMVDVFTKTPQERMLRKMERMFDNALDGTLVGDVGKTTTQYSIETPTEIADLTESNASTTPELSRMANKQIGDSESKLYESIQSSSIFDDSLKSLAANDLRIKYYEGITNAETLNEANAELNDGGEKYVLEWHKKDGKTATAKDVAVGVILMQRYQAIGDYQSAIAVGEKLRAMGTNAGQTVQMLSILGRYTPDGMLAYAQQSLDTAFENMVKGKTQKWIDANKDRFKLTNEDIDFIRRRTWQAAQLPNGRDKNILLGEISARIQNKLPPKKGQSIRALQRISMLLNPKTNVRNIMGNVTITPMHIVSDFFASGVDKLISQKTDTRTTGMYDVRSVKGFKQGLYESFDDFRRKINTRDVEANRWDAGNHKAFNEMHKFKPLNALTKALNGLDRTTSFLLDAGDRPFFEMWFINSLNNQVRLNNAKAATPEMIEIARQDALTRTWQDNNKLTRGLSEFKRILNHANIKGYGLGDVFIKFVKTPANLTKAIVDFSPVGLVKTLAVDCVKFKNAVQTGQATPQMQRNLVRNLGNGITGSLFTLLIALLVDAGLIEITGDESDRDKETDFSRNVLGVQSYSVKVGDKYYSYDWAQPVGATVAIVADFMEGRQDETESEYGVFNDILGAFQAGGKVLYDQSFMQSIQNFFAEDDPWQAIIKGVLDEPAVFVPQALSQFAQLSDDTVRTSYEYDSPVQTALNRAKAKIPGLRQGLEPVVDVLGRDVPTAGGVFNSFVNPANINTMRATPEGEELYRVYSITGETSTLPATAPYYIMSGGEKVKLTPKQRTEYQRITGQTITSIVSDLLSDTGYRNMPDDEKAYLLSKANSYSVALAKKNVLGIEPNDEIKKIMQSETEGVPVPAYLIYKAVTSGLEADKDANGDTIPDSKKTKVLQAIDSLNLTAEQKDYLYMQAGYAQSKINQTPWHGNSTSNASTGTDWTAIWEGILNGN